MYVITFTYYLVTKLLAFLSNYVFLHEVSYIPCLYHFYERLENPFKRGKRDKEYINSLEFWHCLDEAGEEKVEHVFNTLFHKPAGNLPI